MKRNQYIKVFEVLNNREGKNFIHQMKKFLNKGNHVVQIRGRHNDRKSLGRLNYMNDVPLRQAERFAVYISCKSADEHFKKLQTRVYNAEDKLDIIKRVVDRED